MVERDTFRVQGVPLDWSVTRLRACLEEHDPSSSPAIRSFALEDGRRSYTATVVFKTRPLVTQGPKPWDISLSESGENHSSETDCITIDDDLLGMTTLYMPSADNHKVDIIALGNMSGCPLDSFEDEASNHVWLRDALPAQLLNKTSRRPMARVMTYGFESLLNRKCGPATFQAIGNAFLKSLMTLRSPSVATPTILIGHGVGGLIITQALVNLSISERESDQTLLDGIRAVFFFAVPNNSRGIASLCCSEAEDGSRQQLEDSLSQDESEILRQMLMKVFTLRHETRIFSFYETLESAIAQKVRHRDSPLHEPDTDSHKDGSVQKGVVLSRASAIHRHPWAGDDLLECAIPRTHADIAKFEPHDPEYDAVRNTLLRLVRQITSD
ncbi:hypothetical protein BBK36DRAFT_1107742 [Trichoderma citrinoviride]|uniref:DUF676 domain-containing protein n=1 Tax=Trichoderma citrinoviride TaxID=58853 RepID=A0A2T4BLV1_9HYPO|nr:hypothetical protein BBK36DRAFT_1107742 [Trichoderma citrinoviride]PTB70292.1 hypothetical protein BBK36DRAFT_1107742 [Trichoderma citrinoviride]